MFKTKMSTALGAIMVAASVSSLPLSSAYAADLGHGSLKDTGPVYAAPTPVWTGFYVGVHGGYGDAEWDGTLGLDDKDDPYSIGYDDPNKTIDGDGFFGGGQIGYNLQRGNIVFGVEADAALSGVDGSQTFTTDEDWNCCTFSKAHSFEIDSFGSLRGRLGYASGGFLGYVTGGFAWANVDAELSVTDNGLDGTSHVELDGAEDSNTHTGFAVGGGVEQKLDSNWSIKAEYLYYGLGEEDYAFPGTKVKEDGEPYPDGDKPVDEFNSTDIDFHTVKIGLNYRFGSVREPMESLK